MRTSLQNYLVCSILSLPSCLPASADSAIPQSLVAAAEAADWEACQKYLLSDIPGEVNEVQLDGMTALLWAVHHDEPVIVNDLIQHKADVNLANEFGITPLEEACQNGNPEITRLLLTAGADPNRESNGKQTVLMTASRTGNVDVVRQLIGAGAEVNRKQQNGQTALMWAAAEGHRNVVRELLKAGAKSSITLRSGFDAYFLAARAGHTDVVFDFLSEGHDVDDAIKPERSGGKLPRKGMSALMLALENAHFELVQQLLLAGANPNDTRSGFSALHALTWVRKPNKGDNPNDDPPPQSTGAIGSLECAAILVRHGADVNLRLKGGRSGRGVLSHKGATPFLLAADTADVPYMKQLLTLGADPTIANSDDSPPLLAAAGIGSKAPEEEAGTEPELLRAVQLLLELGADVNYVDRNGETAMHGAAYKNVPQVVALLDASGADASVWNQPNKYGWTPLRIARGFRPGNFKPDAATEAAIIHCLQRHGITVPPTPPKPSNNDAYAKKKKQGVKEPDK